MVDYRHLLDNKFRVELKTVEGNDVEGLDLKNTMPLHLGIFVLSKNERLMTDFVFAIDGFKEMKKYYSDTDSLYIEEKINSVNKKVGKGMGCKKVIMAVVVFFMLCL